MTDTLTLPTGSVAEASIALVRRTASAPITEHSIRSFLFARLLAEHDGSRGDAAYDEGLLFAACLLHDLGLGTLAAGQARFEVEGADLAASVLRDNGVPAADVDRVWEAIALHSSVGIADRRGLITSLTHKGVYTDLGQFTALPADQVSRVVAAHPRPAEIDYLRDAIVAHAARSEAAAPPYSLPGELLRQSRS